MGLERAIEHGKEHRKPYRDSRAFDYSCRHHGGCDYCERNRLFNRIRKEQEAKDALEDYGEVKLSG